ncbi:pilus assembly protein [Sphingobium sp. AR-3-1]|uniref:Pilus assembly protein n=1 Tax=Sphingobium psychrophilum TaxID=2728834 RepID=A0A7X9X0J3_9SPHN|nr:TadE family protein [Sphingobium psychrophilum]MBJ7441746.1 pilus assembly protein [Sphingopyxis sp.]NML12913.1 pilus assembly protein [Sphingobium psychrophilum]
MTDLRRSGCRLIKDQAGATIVEFGLISTVLVTTLLGFMDLGHSLYVQSVLQGTVQKSARDATLESGKVDVQQQLLDAAVRERVQLLAANSTVTFSRRYFRDFTKAAQATAEAFQDINANGLCDNDEPFQDNNRNTVWDRDGGDDGQGGAKDDVVYTVNMTYPRLLPIAKLVGLPENVTVEARTVLENQPFGEQGAYGSPIVGHCT